jgi:adenylyltransferase/sulfurtransferase
MSKLNRDQLVQLAKSEITEISAQDLKRRLAAGEKLTVVDVRERDEFVQGHIPDAVFIPRGYLELQIEQHQPEREQPVVVYCAGGVRSALAARNLKEMGYANTISLIGHSDGSIITDEGFNKGDEFFFQIVRVYHTNYMVTTIYDTFIE